MLPRLATLAPLAAALAAAVVAAPATVATLATGTAPVALPNCTFDSPENATATEVFCLMEGLYLRLRFTHTPAALTEESRLVVVCEPRRVRRTDFEALYAMNLRLGETHSVVLHQCPVPAGPLRRFLDRLGVHGVRFVRVASLWMLNDTMPADFLDGLDLETFKVEDMRRIELHDDFFASTGGLHNLTIKGTDTSLPEDLLRHTPQLRNLHISNMNADRIPTTFLHGLHNLTKLLAGPNRLRELTHEHFRDLRQLRYLDLYKNKLETLPGDVFSSLGALEVLRMECNPFHALPESLFAGTPRLKLLRINGRVRVSGDVPSLPAGIFAGLSQLELLMLDRLGLERLPPGLFRGLTALQNLTLDHNELNELPDDSFSELRDLLNLDLSYNRLRRLRPGLLRGLESLDTLYLSGNGLTELPREMFARTPNLQRLFLKKNNLTRLDDLAFSGLDFILHHLDLSSNNLRLDTTVPAFASVRELRNLDLSNNRIQTIPVQMRLNMRKLKVLNLKYNELQALGWSDVNFLSIGAQINMTHNKISNIDVKLEASEKDRPNVIQVRNNPLTCDCSAISLNKFLKDMRALVPADKPAFLLDMDGLKCAGPASLVNRSFTEVEADELVCQEPKDCPDGCTCNFQPSRQTLIVSCSGLPSRTPDPANGKSVSLQLGDTGLRSLGNMSWLTGPVARLNLSDNLISELTPVLLPAGLRELRLDRNKVERVGEPFLERLDAASNNETRLWLGHNPFVCDCALLPLHHYLQLHLSGKSLRIMDANQMTCIGDDHSSLLEMTSEQLCPSHTTTIVVVCVVASAIAICLLVLLCVYYRHAEMLKVWLYAHNLCLWFVTEEELDADKKYDAFVSYSHLDEQFVVEQIVPELERGDPSYELCIHFRDWLAGEWITDQIQRSVQDSRRVIVVMSKNFIQSEWGRLEFLAAHKQALEDKRNRVIVIKYGDLPDPESMDPELRLYISMNTYLEWGDANFWQRLRYALPHKGRRLKQSRGHKTEKLGMTNLAYAAGSPMAALPSEKGVPSDSLSDIPSKFGDNDAYQADKLGNGDIMQTAKLGNGGALQTVELGDDNDAYQTDKLGNGDIIQTAMLGNGDALQSTKLGNGNALQSVELGNGDIVQTTKLGNGDALQSTKVGNGDAPQTVELGNSDVLQTAQLGNGDAHKTADQVV